MHGLRLFMFLKVDPKSINPISRGPIKNWNNIFLMLAIKLTVYMFGV